MLLDIGPLQDQGRNRVQANIVPMEAIQNTEQMGCAEFKVALFIQVKSWMDSVQQPEPTDQPIIGQPGDGPSFQQPSEGGA